MNRERRATGVNSYEKELGLNPIEFIQNAIEANQEASWIDLCCGRGRALIEAAEFFVSLGMTDKVRLIGIDLIDHFDPVSAVHPFLSEASLHCWQPQQRFDLITCVHGTHYVADKLDLIARAIDSLCPNGLFLANLDLNHFRLADGSSIGTQLLTSFEKVGIQFNPERHVLSYRAPVASSKSRMNESAGSMLRKECNLEFLGADDGVGANYTGQEAVDSYYVPRS